MREKYRNDPVGFNRWVLCRPAYWWRQEEICASIIDYRTTVAFTGNSTGKDYLLGGIIPWWLYTRPDSLVIVTGVSQTILGSVTWKEVRRAVEGSPILRAERWKISAGVKASPQTVEVRPGWHALGYSTTNVERASGQHAPELLVIMNEASGIEDEIYDAMDSLNPLRMVVFGNPIRADGRFVELIRQAERDRVDDIPKAMAVNAIQIPSTDSPHAELARSPVGLADKTWLESMYRRYGKDSLWVRSHIKAEVPVVSADALISEQLLDWAASRPAREFLPSNHPIHGTRRIACDLGEGVGRDSSCVLVRDDWGILEVRYGAALGLPEAAHLIYQMRLKYDVPDARISYDKMGIGRTMPNHLARHGIKGALPYAGSASPYDQSYANIRTEAAWRLKLRLDPTHAPGIAASPVMQRDFCIPYGDYWPRMREELRVLTYQLVGKKVKLMPKEEHCEILGHSPDLSDALIQSFGFH